MGFLNTVGKIGLSVGKFAVDVAVDTGKELINTSKEAVEIKKDYKDLDENSLRSTLKKGSNAEKMAASSILRERKKAEEN
ncbi:MAG: hypothetical protein GQ532_19025 [Methylomarinum sp.]|nr:hypothetical protein [Methylomarinum sp.]